MTTNLCLSLTSNYLESIDETEKEIVIQYLRLNQTLLNHIQIHISIKNEQYLKYIILYGCETIAHIFKLLLQYTKSLTLAVHHTEKSILFYVEFITQIGDENHTFLQLNSKDAVIFLYKKTIFDIDETYLKTFTETVKDKEIILNVHNISQFVLALMGHSLTYFKDTDALMKTCLAIDKQLETSYSKIKKNIEKYTLVVQLLSPEFKNTTDLLKYVIQLHKKNKSNALQIVTDFKQSK